MISGLRTILPLAAAIVAGAAHAQSEAPPLPTGSTVENANRLGKAPPGLRPPSRDMRVIEGTWYPFRGGAGPNGPPPAGAPKRPTALDNDENAPFSAQLCAPQPVFFGGMGVGIVQTPDSVVILNEESQNSRVIHLGGAVPADVPPSRNGYSIGHWEGDTLVVTTTGLVAQGGAPSATTVVEHIRRLPDDSGILENIVHATDAKTGGTRDQRLTFRWRPDLKVNESVCEEGFADFVIKDGKLVHSEEGQ